MRRALLLGLTLLLTACAPRATTPPEGRPPLVPPAVAYRLRLEAPGSAGEITLTKALEYLMGRSNKALPTYRVEGTITQTDDLGTWRFYFAPLDILDPESLAQVHGIGVQFRNGLRDTIEVEWARSAIVDQGGRARSVIHRGVRLATRTDPSAPSIIPAGAALDDFLFPADLITYRSGRLGMWTAVGFLERLQPGQVVTVSFGLRITGQPGERAFRFRAAPPT
jgi:hypothetical protein